jgi:hypothetical protein
MKTFEDVLTDFGMVDVGLVPIDGQIHRFKMVGKSGKPGWAIKYDDGSGNYNCWSGAGGDDGVYWHPSGKEYSEMSQEYRDNADRRRDELRQLRIRMQESVANDCTKKWQTYDVVTKNPYLEFKQVGAFGVCNNNKGELVIPLRDINGKIWSLQIIYPNGEKRFVFGGRKSGCMHIIDGDSSKTILCEGYATGASIHAATGCRVVVCFDADNMLKVAEHFPGALVAADNDVSGKGQSIAESIKDKYGIPYVMPEVYGDFNDIACSGVDITDYFFETIEAFSVGDYMADKSPIPADIISPRILTPGGMLVFGGAPKVGKSDFILSWLMHMAAGSEFMGMKPAKPLKVFYLQAEIGYHYLRERINCVDISRENLGLAQKNMLITPRIRMLLDVDGVSKVGNTIRKMGGCDIIAIDPLRNVYDQESENDNPQMMRFLQGRVEALRQYANDDCGIIIAHHTKKIAKDDLIADPFQCFSGASSLRGFYNTGVMMYRPDESVSERVLAFELRDGKPIDNIHVDKFQGRWCVVQPEQQRISHEIQGKKNDNERDRKMNLIVRSIAEQGAMGNIHTKASLALYLDNKDGLGSVRTIETLIDVMLAQEKILPVKMDGSTKVFLGLQL